LKHSQCVTTAHTPSHAHGHGDTARRSTQLTVRIPSDAASHIAEAHGRRCNLYMHALQPQHMLSCVHVHVSLSAVSLARVASRANSLCDSVVCALPIHSSTAREWSLEHACIAPWPQRTVGMRRRETAEGPPCGALIDACDAGYMDMDLQRAAGHVVRRTDRCAASSTNGARASPCRGPTC